MNYTTRLIADSRYCLAPRHYPTLPPYDLLPTHTAPRRTRLIYYLYSTYPLLVIYLHLFYLHFVYPMRYVYATVRVWLTIAERRTRCCTGPFPYRLPLRPHPTCVYPDTLLTNVGCDWLPDTFWGYLICCYDVIYRLFRMVCCYLLNSDVPSYQLLLV